jgi:PadR family transcriptional regulator
MRTTHSLVQVALALMRAPARRHWGYELGKSAGVRSGALYPILRRMLADGWLSDGWEDPATIQGRPPRRYYEITDDGRRELGALLARAETDLRFRALEPGWAR